MTMPPESNHHPLQHPTLLLLLFVLASGGGATKFDFGTLTLESLKLLGDAHLKNGSIRLSRDLAVPTSGAGRALYAAPLRLRPFSTSFAFSVSNLNPSSVGGGLAFLLTADDKYLGDAGGFLGLSAPNSSPFVAVEFDTLMDVQFYDINGNHVGLDLNSLVSSQSADLDLAAIDLRSGDLISAWIDYDGSAIHVFVSYSTERPLVPVLSVPVDLARILEEFVYVGFSGSTQGSTEIHSIDWWSFESSNPVTVSSASPPSLNPSNLTASPPNSIPVEAESPNSSRISSPSSSSCRGNGLCRRGPAAVAGVATAGAFAAAAFAGIIIWMFVKRAKPHLKLGNAALSASVVVNSPKEFTYRELKTATRGFDPSRIIGHGAFGTVYKGIVPSTGAMVAVKRCIHGSSEGKADLLSELAIIASLRHRNLIRLEGWCHEKGEVLIVYDYMVHGSLDKALFDPNSLPLTWRQRTRILAGVAAALAYLHGDCESQVIHRDVKSSNVMLDEGYHARLGDFGLARLVDHGRSPGPTAAAGTMGYLAPEYLLTGRATEKTDVFSFGTLILEVASGRRPIADNNNAAGPIAGNLVEWVWRLYGEGRAVEAADGRMEGGFDYGELEQVVAVGLACASPDPVVRPRMRAVVQMLSGEAPPPAVPTSRPPVGFSADTRHLLMSLQDSVSDCNAMGLNFSSSSSSSSSLVSTLRGGGRGG